MNLNSTATNILVIWYLAGSMISIGIIASMTLVLYRLSKRLEAIENQISPLIDQTSEVLRTVNKTVIQAEPSIINVLSNIETTSGSVAKTGEAVAETTTRILSNPMGEVTAIKDAMSSMVKRPR